MKLKIFTAAMILALSACAHPALAEETPRFAEGEAIVVMRGGSHAPAAASASFSSTATRRSYLASSRAIMAPITPAPITATSNINSPLLKLFASVRKIFCQNLLFDK